MWCAFTPGVFILCILFCYLHSACVVIGNCKYTVGQQGWRLQLSDSQETFTCCPQLMYGYFLTTASYADCVYWLRSDHKAPPDVVLQIGLHSSCYCMNVSLILNVPYLDKIPQYRSQLYTVCKWQIGQIWGRYRENIQYIEHILKVK